MNCFLDIIQRLQKILPSEHYGDFMAMITKYSADFSGDFVWSSASYVCFDLAKCAVVFLSLTHTHALSLFIFFVS